MNRTETKWLRVNRDLRCPVCGKADWCLVADDKSAAICPRTESTKRCGDAGYLHRLSDEPHRWMPPRVFVPLRPSLPDFTAIAEEYQRAALTRGLSNLAMQLGVPAESLTKFGVGWAATYSAWAFPMTNPATGNVTGIRLRPLFGRKFSVTGSKEALFLPPATGDVLLVLEGETDAIAAHGIGFPNAVGRPSCTGGTSHLVTLVRVRKPPRVVIVRDNDKPGVQGADALARVLVLHCRDVRVIAPPDGVKDMRDWIASGARLADVEQLITAAQPRQLNLNITKKGTK